MNLRLGNTYALDYKVLATDYSNFALVIIMKCFVFEISNFNFNFIHI